MSLEMRDACPVLQDDGPSRLFELPDEDVRGVVDEVNGHGQATALPPHIEVQSAHVLIGWEEAAHGQHHIHIAPG